MKSLNLNGGRAKTPCGAQSLLWASALNAQTRPAREILGAYSSCTATATVADKSIVRCSFATPSLLGCFVAILAGCGPTGSAVDPSERASQGIQNPNCDPPAALAPLLVTVTAVFDSGGIQGCSGILFDARHAYTANHCFASDSGVSAAAAVIDSTIDGYTTEVVVDQWSQVASRDLVVLTLAEDIILPPRAAFPTVGTIPPDTSTCEVYGRMNGETDGAPSFFGDCSVGVAYYPPVPDFGPVCGWGPRGSGDVNAPCYVAGYEVTNYGDSGGPLFCGHVLVGVTHGRSYGKTGFTPIVLPS